MLSDVASLTSALADRYGFQRELGSGGMATPTASASPPRPSPMERSRSGSSRSAEVRRRRDIYARRLGPDSTTLPVVTTPASDFSPALSPDARWLAYVSEETGEPEVWIVPFPESRGAKWQISTGGGMEAVWSHDGREIFYAEAIVPSFDPP